jgi:hypothetical protein
MKFPGPFEWKNAEISSELHKFFVLLWWELFDEHTLDSWQVRSGNVRTILQEILESIRVAEDHAPFRHNVPHLLQEALSSCDLDPVFRTHFSFAKQYLTRGRTDSGAKVPADPNSRRDAAQQDELASTASLVRIVLDRSSDYRQRLIADLRGVLSSASDKEKEQVARLTLSLATELSVTGYSTPYLRQVSKRLLDPSLGHFVQRFDSLLAACSGKELEFTCLIPVRGSPTATTSPAVGLRFLAARSSAARSPEETLFTKKHRTVAEATVRALDSTSARTAAEERLESALSAYALYQFDKAPAVGAAEALVMEIGGTPELLLPRHSGTSLKYSLNWQESGTKLLELCSRLQAKPEERERLVAALDYHRIAISAHTEEAKLVNLWVALECLIEGSGTSTIERICRAVPPALVLGHTRRLVSAVAIYIHDMWRTRAKELKAIFPKYDERRLAPEDLLEVLLDPKDSPRVQALFDIVADNPLVKYRIFRLREHALDSPEGLAKRLEHNRQNIDWQLRRIYRARNHVVHRAVCPRGAWKLVENLHAYLVLTTQAVVRDLSGTTGLESIRDVFEGRRLLLDYFINELRLKKRSDRITRPVLLNPDFLLESAPGEETAWSPPPKLGPSASKAQSPTEATHLPTEAPAGTVPQAR